MRNLNEQVNRMKYLISRDIGGKVKPIINEDTLEYDPTQVVHKDEDVVVIDLGIDADNTNEFDYDEDDVKFEDDEWLVINPDGKVDADNTNDYDFYGAGPSDMDDDGIPDNEDDQLGEQKTDIGGHLLAQASGSKDDPLKKAYKGKTYKISESQQNLLEALFGNKKA